MAAIAQTLDGTETFETKEELFDYVLSVLFDLRCPVPRYTNEGVSYIQISKLKIRVKDIEFSI